ncbi:MAG TPA: hypothetical protein VGP21_07100 [Opitutaceae bacterium]|jgi:hypothetical protein|nr:hypothetical protein [Opitutaceae bacterium]
MNAALQKFKVRWLSRKASVPVASCVHYGGFRYGHGEYNPYETYLCQLVQAVDPAEVRAKFIEFLQHYRPRHLGEALGVELTRPYPLWFYPWSREMPPAGWRDRPADCPDILTHFSAQGILRYRIEEEFQWLERALDSIRRHGFQPERFKSPIFVRRLVRMDGATAHLVLDGNHRLSALCALGHEEVEVSFLPWATLRQDQLSRWQQIRQGAYDADDARRVFAVYFEGNHRPRTREEPASLLEANG